MPVRVPVATFAPDRSQRRCAARNARVETRIVAALRDEEHLALYQRYLAARHPLGGMDDHGAVQFDQFLAGSWSDTRFLEIRRKSATGLSELLAVAVTDLVDGALSAVYTFYDPEDHASYGTYNVMWQIEQARSLGLPHVYLGYWIQESTKMNYKARFTPHEIRVANTWICPPDHQASGRPSHHRNFTR